jgi:hypothetical protein
MEEKTHMTFITTIYNMTIGSLIDHSTFDEYAAAIGLPQDANVWGEEDIWGTDENFLVLLEQMLGYFETEHEKTTASLSRLARLVIYIARIKHNIEVTRDIIEYKRALSVLHDKAA